MPNEHAQGHRLAVQPCRVGIADVADERRCVRVLFEEQAVREAPEVGYGKNGIFTVFRLCFPRLS